MHAQRKFWMPAFAFAAAMLIGTSAFGLTLRHDVPDEAYLSFAQDPMFDSFVNVNRHHSGNRFVGGGGTLVGDGWIWASAHQFELTWDYLTIGNGDNLFTDTNRIEVLDLYIDDRWDGVAGSRYDQAMLWIGVGNNPIGSSIADIYQGPGLVHDQVVSFVGQGSLSLGDGTDLPFDGLLRAGQNRMTVNVDGGRYLFQMDAPGWRDVLDLEAAPDQFDSGSGIYVGDYFWGQWLTATLDSPNYGMFGGARQYDAEWAGDIMASHSVVPEPATLTLVGIGLASLALRSRRKKV